MAVLGVGARVGAVVSFTSTVAEAVTAGFTPSLTTKLHLVAAPAGSAGRPPR